MIKTKLSAQKVRRLPQLEARSQRGSVLLLVLGMLAILLLLAIGFSYTTRLESQTSANYAELTQARSAAASGLPFASALLTQSSLGMASPIQPWSVVPAAMTEINSSKAAGKDAQPLYLKQLSDAGINYSRKGDDKTSGIPQAQVKIVDLSSKINLNSVQSEPALERVVKAILPSGNTKLQTRAIVNLRGETLDLDDKKRVKDQLDPRTTSTKELLTSLAKLRVGMNRKTPLFSEKELTTLAKHVTVFSQAPEVYNLDDGTSLPKIALNVVEAQVTYDTLKKAFPHKSNDLLMQFAANVTDFTDEDSIPTIFDADGKVIDKKDPNRSDMTLAGKNYTIGIEQVPFITEVYPDSVTPSAQGDGGQFIELHNPWNKTISLNGWQLKINGGASVTINETLPPNSRLVITDNYDSARPETEAGNGSILAIFGATKDDLTKKVIVSAGLSIPDRNSHVSLFDNENNLMDFFEYGTPGSLDSKKSFQRPDIFARGSVVAEATPFRAGPGEAAHTAYVQDIRNVWENGNGPVEKITDLFRISSAFSGSPTSDDNASDIKQIFPGQFPDLRITEATDDSLSAEADTDPFPTNMDLRIIDIFTVVPWEAPLDNDNQDKYVVDPRTGVRRKVSNNDTRKNNKETQSSTDNPQEEETTNSLVFSYGKLNINTCSPLSLLGIELGDEVNSGKTMDNTLISEIDSYKRRQLLNNKIPFRNLSDFIGRFARQTNRSNLSDLDRLIDQMTVSSSAFEITSTNLLSEKDMKALDDKNAGRRPTVATVKWVISTDSMPYNIVEYSTTP